MKSADASERDRDVCRPALLWDVPALRALKDEGAETFVRAFQATPDARLDVAATEDPLLIAAAIVVHERSGNPEEAAPLYGRLAESPWRNLLSACLRAWAPTRQEPEAISMAEACLSDVDDDDHFQARVLAKLAGVALDRNEFERGTALLERAITYAGNSRLGFVLQFERANVVGGLPPFHELGELSDTAQDPLVDFDWIDIEALGGAREQLADMLQASARSPWTVSLRVGQTPIDRAIAAEHQSSWAGALWLRTALRKQLGCQVLLSSSPTSEQLAYGMLMWLLGDGQDRKAIAAHIEPRLRQEDLDGVITYLLAGADGRRSRRLAAAEVALALWDCVSDSVAESVLDAVAILDAGSPVHQDIARLWAAFAVRAVPRWSRRFLKLEAPARRAIAAELSPTVVDELDIRVVEDIAALLQQEPSERGRGWLIRAAIVTRLGEPFTADEFSGIPVGQLLDVANQFPELVPDELLHNAGDQLVTNLEQSARDARAGKFGFGAEEPVALLGRVVSLLGEPGRVYVPALLNVVADLFLPGTTRLAGLTSLAIVASELGLDERAAAVIRDAPLTVPSLGFMAVDRDVLEAAKLLALYDRLDREEESALVALVRSHDARARQIAVNAAGLAYRQSRREALGHALLSALFDPEANVVQQGLSELSQGPSEDVGPTLIRRIPTLVTNAPRAVRAGAVALGWSLTGKDPDHPLVEVLQLARKDKSWRVRSEAM